MLQTLFEQFINEEGTWMYPNLNLWFNSRLETAMSVEFQGEAIESIKLTRL